MLSNSSCEHVKIKTLFSQKINSESNCLPPCSPAHLFDALWGHVADDLCWHVEVLGSHVTQRDAVLCQQFGEGMNRAAMFQITNHSYLTKIKHAHENMRYKFDGQSKSRTVCFGLKMVFLSLTVMPLTVPSSSLMVKTSSRAWVGCSPTPSPALITGLRQWREALWTPQRETSYMKVKILKILLRGAEAMWL